MGNYCCYTGSCNAIHQKCHCYHSAPLAFHPVARGSAIKFSSSWKQAERQSGFCNGIVFISRPINIMEKVVLEITESADSWQGELRLGFTSVNPSEIDPSRLPQFACPDLVWRPRYWGAVLKREDMVSRGSLVKFWVKKRGSVCYRLNDSKIYNLCDGVPTNIPLWAFVDIYGRTKAVRLLGTFTKKKFGKFQNENHSYIPINNSGLAESLPISPFPNNLLYANERHNTCQVRGKSTGKKCMVCCSQDINTVVYKCGHMCMCYVCSQIIFKINERCPICQQPISDIIKTFISVE